MQLDELVGELDAFFNVAEFEPDSPFSGLVPRTYAGTDIRLESYLENSFLQAFHGLMARNGGTVDKIYSLVFLSDEMVEKVLASCEGNALLICHHPLAMETSNRGFLPLSQKYFVEMQNRAVSVYVLHTPLDVHDEISTSRALARELGLEQLRRYYQVPGGHAGVHGRLRAPIEFDELLRRVEGVTGVVDLHSISNHDVVHTMGIIAGGTDVAGIMEASALGCDTMLTGVYYNLVQNEIGQTHREEFDRIRGTLDMSLIECSHYASEAVVMREDIVDFCLQRFGTECEFVPQDDPWY